MISGILRLPETRIILFEKWNEKSSKQIEMEDFFYGMLNNCEIKTSEKYKDIFYVKDDLIYFYHRKNSSQESKNEFFLVRYSVIWSVFETRFKLSYNEIQVFIQHQVEEHLKLEGFTPEFTETVMAKEVEEHLKLEGFTPRIGLCVPAVRVEEHLKLEGFTPHPPN